MTISTATRPALTRDRTTFVATSILLDHHPSMTSSLPDRSHADPDAQYADVPSFLSFSGIAWPQVAMLVAIGAAVLGPIGLALLLAA